MGGHSKLSLRKKTQKIIRDMVTRRYHDNRETVKSSLHGIKFRSSTNGQTSLRIPHSQEIRVALFN